MKDPYKAAVEQLKEVGEIMGLLEKEVESLAEPEKVYKGEFEIEMDGGEKRTFEAFRSQHNSARGPYKGGIRFHPQVSESEVKALSMWMSWKCGVVGIPYGGGKGGVIVDVRELSRAELERLSRAYSRWASGFVGPWKDVPAPDVNTNSQVMAWMVDELEEVFEENEKGRLGNLRASFTGKPVEIGGSKGRVEATGKGGFYVLENLREKKGWERNEVSLAVQGMGKVGYWFAKFVSEAGYRVVAVSDSQGGVYKEEGLEVDEVMEWKRESGSVTGYEGAEKVGNGGIFGLDVKVIVPAALEGVLDRKVAEKVKAEVVLEMANGPTTVEGDEVLQEKGVLVVPDILANAGGVTTSYFEWVQNLQGYYWEKSEVLTKLKKIMDRAFEEVWEMKERLEKEGEKSDLRVAAYGVSVRRVLEAMRILGRV